MRTRMRAILRTRRDCVRHCFPTLPGDRTTTTESAMNDTLSASQRPTLESLDTPCLVLDETRMTRNIERLNGLMAGHGVRLRPHLKTPKSIDVARRVMTGPTGPAAVSTLQEAEQFAAAGITDLLYAVGVSPANWIACWPCAARGGPDRGGRQPSGRERRRRRAQAQGEIIPALIEIDCDGHRAGPAGQYRTTAGDRPRAARRGLPARRHDARR